jgi:hypothetical protein
VLGFFELARGRPMLVTPALKWVQRAVAECRTASAVHGSGPLNHLVSSTLEYPRGIFEKVLTCILLYGDHANHDPQGHKQ